MLWGTRQDNTYMTLGASKDLMKFLQGVGATDPNATAKLVQDTLRSFTRQDDQDLYLEGDKPVAIRYAPMHLYNLPNMPGNMKAFCALGISGAELSERNTFFTQTIFFARELMHKAGEFTYLDLLFGNHIYSATELRSARAANFKSMNYDRLPVKVVPELEETDRGAVIKIVDALYAGKNVVICPEAGEHYNRRVNRFLTQVYSMLPPRLATEVGYSTYEDPTKILDLIKTTSIRIFVISPKADISKVPTGGIEIIKLSEKANIAVPQTEVAQMVTKWMSLPWDQRRAMMESAFAKTDKTYQEADVFISISKECFAAYEKFLRWMKDSSVNGSVADLTTLEKVYKENIDEEKLPFAGEFFKKRIASLLAQGKTLSGLINEAALNSFYASGEEKGTATKEYQFGLNFVKLDKEVIPLVAKKQFTIDKANTEEKLKAQEKIYEAQIASERETAASEKAALQQKYEAIVAQKEEALNAQKQACETLKAQHAAEMEAEKTRQATEIQTYEGRIANIKEEARRLIGERDQKIQEQTAKVQEADSNARLAESAKEQMKLRLEEIETRIQYAGGDLSRIGKEPEKEEHPLKKWILPGIGFAAGMLLIGLIWLIVGLVGGGKDAKETTIPTTAAVVETTAPTTAPTVAPTEEATEETTVPTEPDPVPFAGWEDENLSYNMGISVEGVTCVTRENLWYANDISVPAGYEVVVAFTAEEDAGETFNYPANYALVIREGTPVSEEEVTEGEIPEATEETSETQESAATEGETTDDNAAPAGFDLPEGRKPTAENWVSLSDKISMVMETEDGIILVVGRDDANAEAAIRAAQWFAGETPAEASVAYVMADGTLLDLVDWTEKLEAQPTTDEETEVPTETETPAETTVQEEAKRSIWLYTVEKFSTDPAYMAELQTALNTTPTPVFAMAYGEKTVIFFDYDGDVERPVQLKDILSQSYPVIAEKDIVGVMIVSANG